MYLGVRAVLAKSFARIHESNLVNYRIPPLRFIDPADYDAIDQGDELELPDMRSELEAGRPVTVRSVSKGREFQLTHKLSPRQIETLLAGGLTNWLRAKWGRA